MFATIILDPKHFRSGNQESSLSLMLKSVGRSVGRRGEVDSG